MSCITSQKCETYHRFFQVVQRDKRAEYDRSLRFGLIETGGKKRSVHRKEDFCDTSQRRTGGEKKMITCIRQ